jgi:DNA-binding Lrp family transcriptional regulator
MPLGHRLDDLDLGILRTMVGFPPPPGAGNRWSPAFLKAPYIARALGVSTPTVKERIARMEASGVIDCYMLRPHPREFDWEWCALLYRLPEEDKPRSVQALQGAEGVIAMLDFFGTFLQVVVVHRDAQDLEARLARYAEVTGGQPAYVLYRPQPPVRRGKPLGPMDWRILQALARDARRPLPDVAEELGLTARTVKNRFDRMAREQRFLIFPALERSLMSGLVFCNLLVVMQPGAPRAHAAAVVNALDGHYLFAWLPPGHHVAHFDMGVYGPSMGDVEKLRERVQPMAGVAQCVVLVPCGGYDNPGIIVGEIARRAAAEA